MSFIPLLFNLTEVKVGIARLQAIISFHRNILPMDKKEIINTLERIAILLELKGENPFKSRAYTNGARILKTREENVAELVQSGELAKIKGIGKALVEKITTMVETGSLAYYEKLRAEFPETMFDLLRIPGLGGKKIKVLYDTFGITSLPELEIACKRNRIAGLPGFGLKTQEKILQGIDFVNKHLGQHHIHLAKAVAEQFSKALADHPDIQRLDITGSLRRAKEVVKDVDIVAAADPKSHPEIMQFFIDLEMSKTVVAHGKTKSSVMTKDGLQVDLRLVSEQAYPFVLHHFTGSKEHNTAMRREAKKYDLKMNEYGIFRQDGSSLQCADEKEIFAAFDMAYIAPELREDRGEIEAAQKNELPELIADSDLHGILHNHSTWSDGLNSITEMAQACHDLNMQYLGIADHSQVAVYANGLNAQRLQQQAEEIAALNAGFSDFRIFHGVECDILPDGRLDLPDEVLALLDYVVISVHSKLEMSEIEATDRLLKAMQNPYATILGHPSGRILLGRKGYPLNYHEIFTAAAELGVAIEINTNPYRLDLDWRLIRQAKEAGVKMAINPDAHKTDGLADIFFGVGLARKGWLSKNEVLNSMTTQEIELYFKKKRKKR